MECYIHLLGGGSVLQVIWPQLLGKEVDKTAGGHTCKRVVCDVSPAKSETPIVASGQPTIILAPLAERRAHSFAAMSRQINQPINQVRLTNVAVVRMNKGGKRFEIACYRNKVVDYRQGLETDLSEVLQTDRIFTNVSKGEFSKAKDLMKVFGTNNEEEIARVILAGGQVQVSDKERSQQLEKTTAQIAEWISKNCVQPSTDRPYTISQIRHAMQSANFSVHPTKPLKRQYLDCVKLLQQVMPIQRAKMDLLIVIPKQDEYVSKVLDLFEENNVEWSEEASSSGACRYKILVDPSLYRILNETVQDIEGGQIEIVKQVVTKEGDVDLEAALEHPMISNDDATNEENLSGKLHDNLHLEPAKENDTKSVQVDDESEDDEPMLSRRQQQKKNKKKNRKAQRREVNHHGDSKTTNEQFSIQEESRPQPPTPAIGSGPAPASCVAVSGDTTDRKSCNTCGGSFDTPAAYRAHFKSDWHKFNQKLKLKGVAPISEQEFFVCDAESFFGTSDDLL
eukprot:Nitzschia sp. Nitz4//scaffold54_size114964//30654//32180//NITZ4_003841-RA/size114964-processed-gene-0.180-mRNA-1//-1//CDS//3329554321//3552//frame0